MIFRAFVLGLALACVAAGASAQQQPAQRAQAVYNANCLVCHAPAPGAPLGDLTRRAPATYDAFVHAVRDGQSPSGEMPAFSPDVVSDADLRALHAYITSLRAPR